MRKKTEGTGSYCTNAGRVQCTCSVRGTVRLKGSLSPLRLLMHPLGDFLVKVYPVIGKCRRSLQNTRERSGQKEVFYALDLSAHQIRGLKKHGPTLIPLFGHYVHTAFSCALTSIHVHTVSPALSPPS